MPKRPASFDARLDLIPQEPGVYLMKDTSGSVIYVGKANNLPNRLRSYFTPNPSGDAKVLAMISHIADFSYIVCANELEALILENNLIKEYRPKYNVLLRDDKEYPYLRVTLQEMYPRVLKAFHVGPDREQGARYFGPYLAGDLNHALLALYRIFPMKTCSRVLPRDIGKERPCLNYYIGRCVGPCKGDVSAADYRAVIDKICRFLDGRYGDLLREIKHEMIAHSDSLEFEQAAIWRDRLNALSKLMERQVIVGQADQSHDVLALRRNGHEGCVQKLEIREGRMVGSASSFLPDQGESDGELIAAFVRQHYAEGSYIPKVLLVSQLPAENELLSDFLRLLSGHAVRFVRPQRGEKYRLVEMAEINADQNLRRHTLLGGSATGLQQTLRLLAEKVGLNDPPRRIEAYDIANLGASDRTGSMVVFTEGKPKRRAYRHFHVGETNRIDDYAAMREIITRRLARLPDEAFGEKPDLILIDGGSAHVRAVRPLIRKVLPEVPVIGLVKDARHRTRGLAFADQTVYELRQVIETTESVDERADNMGLLRLLTAIQDEAHRFAGRLHQKAGYKRTVRYSLEAIPGVGPARRRLLLREFKTIKGVSEATLASLLATSGLPAEVAEAVYHHFHHTD